MSNTVLSLEKPARSVCFKTYLIRAVRGTELICLLQRLMYFISQNNHLAGEQMGWIIKLVSVRKHPKNMIDTLDVASVAAQCPPNSGQILPSQPTAVLVLDEPDTPPPLKVTAPPRYHSAERCFSCLRCPPCLPAHILPFLKTQLTYYALHEASSDSPGYSL